ncbi:MULTISPECIES: hypothetical protein [unclassified Roseofilum]|nr:MULTISPECIES: hypothetical protein [unclassified Roseofilum]
MGRNPVSAQVQDTNKKDTRETRFLGHYKAIATRARIILQIHLF